MQLILTALALLVPVAVVFAVFGYGGWPHKERSEPIRAVSEASQQAKPT